MRRQFWRPFRVAVKQRRYHSQPERSEQDENGYAAMSFVPVRAGRRGSCPCDVPAGFNIPCLGRGDWPNVRSCFFAYLLEDRHIDASGAIPAAGV